MPSRRAVLATGILVFSGGCSSRGDPDVDPADHVPDGWHDEPKRGLADPIDRTVEVDANVKRECDSTAVTTIDEEIRTRLDAPDNVHSGGGETEDGTSAVFVYRRLSINRDGAVISSPEITFESIRVATPKSVEITATTGDSFHSCRLPVYVVDSMVQAD
jgi:hypothetical protein